MSNPLLEPALNYHKEGLCVIPVIERDKKPALAWEEYHTRRSTVEEIKLWWGNGHNYNIGIVHGEVSGNFVTLDIDHDSGLVDEMFNAHPYLFAGRIEQSGSGEGYHIPLKLDQLPDFGIDQKQDRPRGNRTWKTKTGVCNIRARFCQTVCAPSIHPSGNPYRFLQEGPITQVANLDRLIEWLDRLAPPKITTAPAINKPTRPVQSDDLLGEVKAVWDCLSVFDQFTIAGQQRKEPNGEIRLLGNGGLLVTEDLQRWYSFADEMGGGVFEAWGYCRFGNSYDKTRHFRQVLLEMAQAAGIEVKKIVAKDLTPVSPGYDLPFDIPTSQKIIIVGGEAKAEVLRDAGFGAIGLPDNIFKRTWARLFSQESIIYIALDPGKERQAEMIAGAFKANGIAAVACYLPVKIDELLSKYGGSHSDLCQFLNYGKRV